MCSALNEEVPGHRQQQLMQTLIVRLFETHFLHRSLILKSQQNRIVLVTRPGATQTVPRGLWERCQSGDPTLNPAVINYRRSKTRKIASAGLATQTTEVAWRPLPTGTLPPLPPQEGAPEPEISCSGTTSVPGCWKSWPPRTTLTTSFQSWPSS